jgi:hypothetical protein
MKDYNADLYDEGGGRDADGKPCKHKVCTSYEDLMAWGRSKLGKPTVGQETTEKSAGNQPAGSSSSKNGGKGEAEESHIHRKDCPVNKGFLFTFINLYK